MYHSFFMSVSTFLDGKMSPKVSYSPSINQILLRLGIFKFK